MRRASVIEVIGGEDQAVVVLQGRPVAGQQRCFAQAVCGEGGKGGVDIMSLCSEIRGGFNPYAVSGLGKPA